MRPAGPARGNALHNPIVRHPAAPRHKTRTGITTRRLPRSRAARPIPPSRPSRRTSLIMSRTRQFRINHRTPSLPRQQRLSGRSRMPRSSCDAASRPLAAAVPRDPPIGAPVAAAPAAGDDMPSRMFCLVAVAWRDAASSGVGPCVAGQPVGGLGLRAAPAGGQCRWDGDRVRLRARRAEPAGRCPATATSTCTRRLRALCQRTVAGAGRLGVHHDGYRGSGPVRVMGGSRRGDRDPVRGHTVRIPDWAMVPPGFSTGSGSPPSAGHTGGS